MLPRVIVHNAVSIDGRTDWLTADVGMYYELAQRWQEDATLAGADTLLQADFPDASPESAAPPNPVPHDARPLLVVPDSRGRVRCWAALARAPYWQGLVALCSSSTPADYRRYLDAHHVECIEAGRDHVNLGAALEELNRRYGVQRVRVDSGGTLNGVLLRAGLVHEVSLLVHPQLIGGTSPRSCFRADDLADSRGVRKARLIGAETLGQIVWLRYELIG